MIRTHFVVMLSAFLATSDVVGGQRPLSAASQAAATPNILSFAAGTVVVERPSEYDDSYTALMLLDDNPKTIWSSAKGVTADQRITFQLAERSVIRTLVLDTAGADRRERSVKDVEVEVSDQGSASGFASIATISLAAGVGNQRFPVKAEHPARWVRLTIRNNHGDPEFVELGEVRGEGTQLTQTPPGKIGGTYLTKWAGGSAPMHIRDQGALVTGCYEYQEGTLTGGMEGRLMRFTWRQAGGSGLAIMVVSPDGQRLNGLYWNGERTDGQARWWDGTKTADAVGTCRHWTGTSEGVMTTELRDAKRSRLYGVTFDFGSEVIRAESRVALDQVANVLKANGVWRVTIEGHTDNVGSERANQLLSERRSAAVKAYLITAGIDAGRLVAAGFGARRPVAANETELGRAQNRRVELVRE